MCLLIMEHASALSCSGLAMAMTAMAEGKEEERGRPGENDYLVGFCVLIKGLDKKLFNEAHTRS